jgi:triacylglycerol esterase/lipase EstA (alpha/beta hydrolase family)
MSPARRLVLGLAAALALPLAGAASAGAATTTPDPVFAPVDTPGPALTVTPAQLAAVLQCSKGVDHAAKAPVLLVQGTGATAKDNWSWTYEPALDKLGIPWCAVDLPDHATSDVQVAGEYVVAAIRDVHARAGRKVDIIGHSQGGMVPRWALRFWPDTRAMVDDVIGFAPSNHGTTQAAAGCKDGCAAADWQQSDTSNFMKALNSRQETFKGISYTVVFTHTDEVVQPNMNAATGSSALRTGDGRITNVATQEICPNDVNEHLIIGLYDPVAYALAVDALTHDGPADPARVPITTCAQMFHPGINPVTFPADAAAALADFEGYKAKDLPAEPPLACYTTASCPATAAATPAKGCASRRRFTVHVPAAYRRAVRATLNGKALKVRRVKGRYTTVVDLRGRPAGTAKLVVRGRSASGRALTQTRTYRLC